MDAKLGMKDVIDAGRGKEYEVSELTGVSGEIFRLIKKGYQFDDEVLKAAHISKSIRDVRVENVIVEHEAEKGRTYVKEKESVRNIIRQLNTLDSQTEETYDTERQDGSTDNNSITDEDDEEV